MDSTFSIASSQLLPQLPTILIDIVAIILGFIYLKHHAKAASLLIGGGSLMLVTIIGSTFAIATFIGRQMESGTADEIGAQMMVTGIVSGLAYALSLALLVAAAVVGRKSSRAPHL